MGMLLLGYVVAHLSYCLNKALFYNMLSHSITVLTTSIQS